MALLGYDGRLTLKREVPDTIALAVDRVEFGKHRLISGDDAIWSGDQVRLYCERGVPTDATPMGMAQYGGTFWLTGPTRTHISGDADPFYRADDTAAFYEDEPAGLVRAREVWVHRDLMGRITLHDNLRDAMNGQSPLPILQVDFEQLVMEPLDADWQFVCGLRSWTLELDAPAIDTTVCGQKFGENVKALVTAGGNIDFLIDTTTEPEWDAQRLLRLALLTEKGAKASARFYMMKDREAGRCDNLVPGSLYYELELLLVNTAISVRIDEAIAGSGSYVSTGEVKLLLG